MPRFILYKFLYSVDGIVFIIRWKIDGSVLLRIYKDYCYEDNMRN